MIQFNHDMSKTRGATVLPAEDNTAALRTLPSVTTLLNNPIIREATGNLAPEQVTAVVRGAMDTERTRLRSEGGAADTTALVTQIIASLRALTMPRSTPLLNATGVILHTNLGRAPVSDAAAIAMRETAGGYIPLEMDLSTGERGGRMAEMEMLFRTLTGCEAALVVNNNAAATLLVLAAVLRDGRTEVVLSRAEAVEIGGSFRIPDILRQSGATLVDIGTTNRTYTHDYAHAVTDRTAALLKVHTSNFRLSGFVHQTAARELVPLADARGIAVIDDVGSGTLIEPTRYGLAAEPTLPDAIAGRAHLVCASGDKLLGGPQAGIILGRREWVARCAAHPLARAFRADKATLAGLAATLRHYLANEHETHIPVWRMIAAPVTELCARCERWQITVTEGGVPVMVVDSRATIGGGSLPGETLPSVALAVTAHAARTAGTTLDALAVALRTGTPAVVPHIANDHLLLDARTIHPRDDAVLSTALVAAWQHVTESATTSCARAHLH